MLIAFFWYRPRVLPMNMQKVSASGLPTTNLPRSVLDSPALRVTCCRPASSGPSPSILSTDIHDMTMNALICTKKWVLPARRIVKFFDPVPGTKMGFPCLECLNVT